MNPHDLAGRSEIAGVTLPEELIALQDFAVKARHFAGGLATARLSGASAQLGSTPA